MKKLLFGIVAAGLMMAACNQKTKGTVSSAQTMPSSVAAPAAGAVAANGPAFKFENETHDFGKVKQGDLVTYNFNFVNIGKSPLIISNAVASCGCTKPEWPAGPIKPGDGGQIKVTFNSAGKLGLQDKMITITANTNPAQSMVHLVGEVTEKTK